ncbi:hypothetical protein F4679DRAFT_208826 [Xylaria curta]|nr:hypothetical protein F4679DRAFT_208826 [Xylaria curta]
MATISKPSISMPRPKFSKMPSTNKSLVPQQVDAYFHIAGIPRSQTTILTREITPTLRADSQQMPREEVRPLRDLHNLGSEDLDALLPNTRIHVLSRKLRTYHPKLKRCSMRRY